MKTRRHQMRFSLGGRLAQGFSEYLEDPRNYEKAFDRHSTIYHDRKQKNSGQVQVSLDVRDQEIPTRAGTPFYRR